MNKDALIGIGITGVAFMSVGALIGGLVVNKINNNQNNKCTEIWRVTAEFLKDQLIREFEKNDKLKEELN